MIDDVIDCAPESGDAAGGGAAIVILGVVDGGGLDETVLDHEILEFGRVEDFNFHGRWARWGVWGGRPSG